MVDIGGYRLHLQVLGEDHRGPCVVLEAGMGSFSSNWYWVQRRLATRHRVVSYDRAGLGWSDRSPYPRDARRMAAELRAALQAADIAPPYVLAGHSFGGLVSRAFVDLFPSDTVGLVLVDASHPDQWARWPLAHADRILETSQRIAAGLAVFGVLRLADPSATTARGLPARQAAELRAHSVRARASLTEARQLAAWRTTSRAQINNAQPLGGLPLHVLSVGNQPRGDATLTELQQELPRLSTNSVRTVVDGATHEALVSDERYAEAVADAIRSVLSQTPQATFEEHYLREDEEMAMTEPMQAKQAAGRDRDEWFDLLDDWGAVGRPYREIAQWLTDQHGVSAWWAQKIVVEYEQERGVRDPGARPDGTFAAGASKTVAAPVERVFTAFADAGVRERWLPGVALRERTMQPGRSARFDWEDGATRINVTFAAAGENKSQVAVEHERLADAEAVEETKTFWRERLTALKGLLEA